MFCTVFVRAKIIIICDVDLSDKVRELQRNQSQDDSFIVVEPLHFCILEFLILHLQKAMHLFVLIN